MTFSLTQGGLYAITDSRCLSGTSLEQEVEDALQGGCTLVQYRDKSSDHAKRRQQAQALLKLCHSVGACLLINDDWRLAADIGAHGVHLGQQDEQLEIARRELGSQAIIGITCHDQLSLAVEAQQQGADYVAFGAFYPSSSKPNARPAPLPLLKQAQQSLQLPVVAIGGITLQRAPELWQQGADWLAVINDIFARQNITEHCRSYLACRQPLRDQR